MRSIGILVAMVIPLVSTSARAESTPPVATTEDTKEAPQPTPKTTEPYRSIVRFGAGPAMFFSKADVGAGLGLAIDFGTGAAGFRLASMWARSFRDGDTSVTSGGLGQYTGEITLDLLKRGPLHPVFGIGFGMLQVYKQDDYFAGIGTVRIGLQYAFRIDNADVRLGLDWTGVLLGPAPHALGDLGGYALANATVAIGF